MYTELIQKSEWRTVTCPINENIKLTGLDAEIEFWRNANVKLATLLKTVSQTRHKVNVYWLRAAIPSNKLLEWFNCEKRLVSNLCEAQENFKYLLSLSKISSPIYGSDPVMVKQFLPSLMYSVKLTCKLSRYYSEPPHMSDLLLSLCVQLVQCCKKCLTCNVDDNLISMKDQTFELVEVCHMHIDLTNELLKMTISWTREKAATLITHFLRLFISIKYMEINNLRKCVIKVHSEDVLYIINTEFPLVMSIYEQAKRNASYFNLTTHETVSQIQWVRGLYYRIRKPINEILSVDCISDAEKDWLKREFDKRAQVLTMHELLTHRHWLQSLEHLLNALKSPIFIKNQHEDSKQNYYSTFFRVNETVENINSKNGLSLFHLNFDPFIECTAHTTRELLNMNISCPSICVDLLNNWSNLEANAYRLRHIVRIYNDIQIRSSERTYRNEGKIIYNWQSPGLTKYTEQCELQVDMIKNLVYRLEWLVANRIHRYLDILLDIFLMTTPNVTPKTHISNYNGQQDNGKHQCLTLEEFVQLTKKDMLTAAVSIAALNSKIENATFALTDKGLRKIHQLRFIPTSQQTIENSENKSNEYDKQSQEINGELARVWNYYEGRMTEGLIYITINSLDKLREHLLNSKSVQLNKDAKCKTSLYVQSYDALNDEHVQTHVFCVDVILDDQIIKLSPSVDKLQHSVNQVVQYILNVSKGVKRWGQSKELKADMIHCINYPGRLDAMRADINVFQLILKKLLTLDCKFTPENPKSTDVYNLFELPLAILYNDIRTDVKVNLIYNDLSNCIVMNKEIFENSLQYLYKYSYIWQSDETMSDKIIATKREDFEITSILNGLSELGSILIITPFKSSIVQQAANRKLKACERVQQLLIENTSSIYMFMRRLIKNLDKELSSVDDFKTVLSAIIALIADKTVLISIFVNDLLNDIEVFISELSEFDNQYHTTGPMIEEVAAKEASDIMRLFSSKFDLLWYRYRSLYKGDQLFNLPHRKFNRLYFLKKELTNFNRLYALFDLANQTIDRFKDTVWSKIIISLTTDEISDLITRSITYEVTTKWIQVQNLWVYLEVMFTGGDISRQLPLQVRNERNAEHIVMLYNVEMLDFMLSQLGMCQTLLAGYLESKRLIFPRFYFLSDPVLLEILGQASEPIKLQPYFNAFTESVNSVKFNESSKEAEDYAGKLSRQSQQHLSIRGIQSEDNESVELVRSLYAQKTTDRVKARIQKCVASIGNSEFDLQSFFFEENQQFGLIILQLLWTATSENVIKNQLKTGNSLKYDTYITIHIHQTDVFSDLANLNLKDVRDFDWTKQSRFYYEDVTNSMVVSITDVDFMYGNEFLGCSERLVITHLTDRCYISLAQALGMCYGGSPSGPAGTGKTETTKDMAKSIGKYCIVLNCSEQFDYKGLGKTFKGLAQSGCWGCFDEFNRINLPVLSVAAQQIQTLLHAKRNRHSELIFTDGQRISTDTSFAIIITMNPGYEGRHELSDNLKVNFRDVAMMVPDR
ncbi:hypothetical protein GJ496_006927 [Pomphorhynchus laevis]|nr:hypothetical protein GJ496_006927 [Pomphorhynchus laevis]